MRAYSAQVPLQLGLEAEFSIVHMTILLCAIAYTLRPTAVFVCSGLQRLTGLHLGFRPVECLQLHTLVRLNISEQTCDSCMESYVTMTPQWLEGQQLSG